MEMRNDSAGLRPRPESYFDSILKLETDDVLLIPKIIPIFSRFHPDRTPLLLMLCYVLILELESIIFSIYLLLMSISSFRFYNPILFGGF